jgi:hypothetical protein
MHCEFSIVFSPAGMWWCRHGSNRRVKRGIVGFALACSSVARPFHHFHLLSLGYTFGMKLHVRLQEFSAQRPWQVLQSQACKDPRSTPLLRQNSVFHSHSSTPLARLSVPLIAVWPAFQFKSALHMLHIIASTWSGLPRNPACIS